MFGKRTPPLFFLLFRLTGQATTEGATAGPQQPQSAPGADQPNAAGPVMGPNFIQQLMQEMRNVRPPPAGHPPPPRMPFPMFPTAAVAGGFRAAPHMGGFGPLPGRGGPRVVGIGVGRMPRGTGMPMPPGMPMPGPSGPRPNMAGVGDPAIFVGPRPPADLPLFTVDPFLPCPSRHFDPRNVGRRHGGRPPAPTTAAQQPPVDRPTQDASTNTEVHWIH